MDPITVGVAGVVVIGGYALSRPAGPSQASAPIKKGCTPELVEQGLTQALAAGTAGAETGSAAGPWGAGAGAAGGIAIAAAPAFLACAPEIEKKLRALLRNGDKRAREALRKLDAARRYAQGLPTETVKGAVKDAASGAKRAVNSGVNTTKSTAKKTAKRLGFR